VIAVLVPLVSIKLVIAECKTLAARPESRYRDARCIVDRVAIGDGGGHDVKRVTVLSNVRLTLFPLPQVQALAGPKGS